MKGIISNDRTELEAINKKINDWMIAHVENYNAVQWGNIIKHPTLEQFALFFEGDSRNPVDRLTILEKTRYVELDIKEWFSDVKL